MRSDDAMYLCIEIEVRHALAVRTLIKHGTTSRRVLDVARFIIHDVTGPVINHSANLEEYAAHRSKEIDSA